MARTTRFWLRMLSIGLLILMRPAAPHADAVAPEPSATAPGSAAAVRLALVVGNGDYRAGPLPTAANDAGLVAQSLAQAGFDVTAGANFDADTLNATVDSFLAKARTAGPDALLVVYLSGYGMQYSGENYIVPVDASIGRDVDVPARAVPLAALARRLAAVPAKARVLIGDLARTTPFAKAGAPLAPGLALVVPPPGVATAFNAAPGAEAPVDASPYGAYARALAEMIQTPGLPLASVFIRVRLRVDELTNGAAVPWTSGTFGDATFYPSAVVHAASAGQAAVPSPDAMAAAAAYSALIASDTLADDLSFLTSYPVDALTPRVRAMAALRREAMIWSDSVKADNPRALWTYMRRYPRGPHVADARHGLARLHAQLEPPPRFDIVAYDDVAPPPPGEADLLDANGDVKGPPIPPSPLTLVPSQRTAFADELAPPLLVPSGVLPIAMPVPLPEGDNPAGVVGTITQPTVPAFGPVVAKAASDPSGSTLIVAGKNGLLFKATETFGGTRSIVQTDPAGATISRTEFARDRAGLLIVQTGPGGGIVWKMATRAIPGGGRSIVATNGKNETLSIAVRDDQGIVVSVKRGSASGRDLNPVYQPAAAGQGPVLLYPTLPAPERVKAPVESDALAIPMPPPALSLPPLPAAPPPAASSTAPRADAPKPSPAPVSPTVSSTAAPPLGTAAKPDKVTKPDTAGTATKTGSGQPLEPPKPEAGPPSPVAPPGAPGVPKAVPEPPRRPDSIEPKHPEQEKAIRARSGARGRAPPAARHGARDRAPGRRR